MNTDRKNCFTACQEELCNSGSRYDENNVTDNNITGNRGGNRRYYNPNAASHDYAPVLIILPLLMILKMLVAY